jgi:hypothetical protein
VASGDDPVPAGPRAVAVRIVDGDVQVGPAERELAEPVRVQVVDEAGRAIPNYVVNFRVVAGGGSVFAGAAMTDANGRAADYWTLGPASADTQRVEVRAVDPATGARRVYATFRAVTGTPNAPVPVGSDTLRVVLTWTRGPQDLDLVLAGPNADGTRFLVGALNPASGLIHMGTCDGAPWACKDRDAQSIPGAETVTIVRQLPGTYRASVFNYSSDATVDPSATKVELFSRGRLLRTIVPPAVTPREWVVFELRDGQLVVPDAPAPGAGVARVVVTPSPASVVVGAQQRFTAEVRDAAGSVLQGRVITWRSSAPAVMTVDSNGVGRALTAGAVEITATAEGVSGTATARVVPGGSRFLAIVSENPTSTTVGARPVMRARVTDVAGAPIAGAQVNWLQEGWATLTTLTNADGEVSIFLPTDRAGTFGGRAQLMSGTAVERTATYAYTVNP